VRSASPYFQNETSRQKACQIDLLIDAKYAVYVCEIKFRQLLNAAIAQDVADKTSKLKIGRSKSLKRVLIYMGALAPGSEESGAFDELVPFERFLG
jgi:hypothetical protein